MPLSENTPPDPVTGLRRRARLRAATPRTALVRVVEPASCGAPTDRSPDTQVRLATPPDRIRGRPVSTPECNSGCRLAVKRVALGPAGRPLGDGGAGIPLGGGCVGRGPTRWG